MPVAVVKSNRNRIFCRIAFYRVKRGLIYFIQGVVGCPYVAEIPKGFVVSCALFEQSAKSTSCYFFFIESKLLRKFNAIEIVFKIVIKCYIFSIRDIKQQLDTVFDLLYRIFFIYKCANLSSENVHSVQFEAYTADAVALFGTNLNSQEMNTIVGYIYDMLYGEGGGYPSYASAAAIILFLIILTITSVNLLVSKQKVHY